MTVRKRRRLSGIGLGTVHKAGIVKGAVLLPLTVLLLLMIFTTGVRNTTAEDCDCNFCHGDQHGPGWKGCSSCHDSPPQTGSHLVHYGSAPVPYMQYGDTANSSDTANYKFGCGNCHPIDSAKHRDGILQVELYDPNSPAGSVKSKNPSSASYVPGGSVISYGSNIAGQPDFSYSNGSCSQVYCHSGYKVTSSGPVGDPLTYPANPLPQGFKVNNGFIMDETCSNVTYAPYTVNSGREYKTTPAWGAAGTFTTCEECHQFPLTTWGPAVEAQVGDSHQWYNDWEGWAYGHANNMDYYPGLPCATCHYMTVEHLPGTISNPPTASPTYWKQVNGTWIHAYYTVPIKSRATHVNGSPDVNFDTVNGYRYYYPGWVNTQVNLSEATYDRDTKTCSDVGCHYGAPFGNFQKKVKWGSPYRGWYGPGEECDQCHRMGYLNGSCTTP